jgi:cytochrome b6-f complex iron-sulfur subunit
VPIAETVKNREKAEKSQINKKKTPYPRRIFLKQAGWIISVSVIGVWLVALIRFFFPRTLFEPSPIFKASFPHTYEDGKVSTKYQETQGVWIIRDGQLFYALLTRCTHLGCKVIWDESAQKFKCPCHGSGFTKEGLHYEGPAPRPLERVKIFIGADGRIVIDKSVKFKQENGEWMKPGAFIKL